MDISDTLDTKHSDFDRVIGNLGARMKYLVGGKLAVEVRGTVTNDRKKGFTLWVYSGRGDEIYAGETTDKSALRLALERCLNTYLTGLQSSVTRQLYPND